MKARFTPSILKQFRSYKRLSTLLAAFVVIGVLTATFMIVSGRAAGLRLHWPTRTTAVVNGMPSSSSVMLVAPPCATSTVYVDDSWVGTAPGTDLPGPATNFGCDSFATIQEGIDGVDVGGTVIVYDGTYNQAGSISLNKSIVLQGPNSAISPNGGARVAEALITGTANPVLRISAPGNLTTIEGFKFDSAGVVDAYDPALDITIRKNIYSNGISNGAFYFLNGPTQLTLDDNHLTNAVLAAVLVNDTIFVAGNWNGATGTVASITNNVIENTPSASASGMNLSNVSGTVSGNQFTTLLNYAILLANNSSSMTVSNNVFDGIVNSDPMSVPSWGAGVRTYTPSFTGAVNITSNTFKNSYTGVGIRGVPNDPGADITGMDIHVNFNRFVNNTFGINDGAAGTLDAENNWWGCNYGPGTGGTGCTGTPNGVGINGSAIVDANPWLVLGTSAAPASIVALTNSTITADMRFNSAAANTSGSGTIALTPVAFSATEGTMAPPTSTITAGQATSTFTSTSSNNATACSTVDGQEICTPITVTPPCVTPATVYVDDSWVGTTPGTDPDAGGPATNFGCDSFATIQDGVTAVPTSGTVIVRAGTYAENVTIAKDISLNGAQIGVDARGRVASESTIAPAAGIAITLGVGSAGATIDGFTLSGGTRGIESAGGPINNLQILNNRIRAFTGAGIFLNDTGVDITVSQNEIDGGSKTSGGGSVHLDADGFDGFYFTNNTVQNAPMGPGLFSDGNRNVGLSAGRSPLFDGNRFENHTTNVGVNIGSRSIEDATFSNNIFRGNGSDGLQGGPLRTTFSGNTFDNNGRHGLALTSFSNLTAGRGASLVTIKGNTISGNGFTTAGAGILYSNQPAGTQATNHANFNRIFGNATGVINSSAEAIDVENNWWGCNFGPGAGGADCSSATNGLGGTGVASIDATPWIVLGISASPNPIPPSGNSTVTADMTHNSAAATPAGGPVPLLPVSFNSTEGTMAPPTSIITAGQASSNYTSTSSNNGTACATVDNQLTCTNIDKLPTTVTITPAGGSATAGDNDYTRINNAIQASFAGQTIKLLGTFDWTETNAAASWALGSNANAGDGDDYSILVPANLNNVTFTADNLGDAAIQGPGDLAIANLEGVLVFDGGDNQNWTISNIRFLDFDLSIGMFNGAGGSDAFNNTHITNNYIRLARDLNTVVAPVDSNQNIGIHYSFGTNQVISGNTIEIQGDAVSNGSNFASDVGMQSNTSGGAVYNGLQITNNIVRVLNAQDAANPQTILGIWENAHGHTSNITVSGNQFLNQAAGNNPATNLQRGFRVTSHSSATTTVTYENNTVMGANLGFQWISGSNFAGNQPVNLKSNTITGNGTGVLVQSQGVANLSFNRIVGNTTTGLNNVDGIVTAENNWWGCNAGPGNVDCDSVTGTADSDPWLVLGVSAAPSSVAPGGSSTVTADMRQNSVAADTSGSGTLPLTPVSFSATEGTMAPPTGTITAGQATSTFTSTSSNSGSACAMVDNQNICTPITITPVSFSIDDVTHNEGNAGTTAYTFTITKTGSTGLTTSVDYATVNGTATAPSDFTAISTTTVQFLPADSSKQVTVFVNGDTDLEPNEAFTVHLSNPSGAGISDADGTGAILNDDTESNDAPVAVNDTLANMAEDDGPRSIPFADLTGNDSKGGADEGGQTLTIINVTNAVGGTVVLVPGFVVFTPTENYNGPASFDYTVEDNGTTAGAPDPKTSTAAVQFNITEVNDAPTAVADTLANVAEDSGERTVSFATLTGNDSSGPANESGQTLIVKTVSNPVGVTVSIVAGTVRVTPLPDHNGAASFQYTAEDNGTTNGFLEQRASGPALVQFTISEVNDAPTAVNDTLSSIAEDSGPRTIPFADLTGNDSKGPANESGQSLIVKTVSNPVGGTVSIVGGDVLFTPTADFNGAASFAYTVEDNGTTNGAADPLTSGTATASFTITPQGDAPSVTNATTNANTQTTSGLVITANPADGPEVTHFKITGITGGSLFKNDGVTPINNGDFITVAEGNAGLKFTPGTTNGSFTVQASTSAADAGLGGGTATATITVNPLGGVIRFSAGTYNVDEAAGFSPITVERTGDTSQAVTVDYASSDLSNPADFIPCSSPGAGFASSRCDFTTAIGTLHFAAGETTKTFNVLISQDNYLEGPETLDLTLSNPTGGAVLGVPAAANLSITDDTVEGATNPVDQASDFVRALYHDMLNREPDGPGLAFWTDNIEKCSDPDRRPAGQTVEQCTDKQRESTAVAFFAAPEFQITGGFVYRLYKGSLTGAPNYDGGSPGRFPTFVEFIKDVSQVSEGIVVNNQISGAVVEANRNQLAAEFVQRPEFIAKYGGLNNTLYVDELFNTTTITATPAEKQALVDGLTNGTETRASVLRKVVDGTVVISEGNVQFTTTYGQAFYNQEFRRVYVYMEYVGFLRRNPDAEGFVFWLGKLNDFNGDPFQAEMVRSFILSPEYRSRFGQ